MGFKKGTSGNPRGRPKDTRTAKVRSMLSSKSDKLIAKAVEMALAGDSQAMRLCLERIVPALKSKDSPVTIPGFADAETTAEKGQAVMAALASGDITPTEAATAMQALAGLSRIIETDELEKRIAALEANTP